MTMRVRMAGVALEIDKNSQVPAHWWFRLGQPVGGLQQLSEVVEVDRNVGVVRPEALLGDLQCSAKEWFRFGPPVGGLQQSGEGVEVNSDIGMVRPEARFVDRQRPAYQRF